MSTKFKGHKTGFNKSGSNEVTPNFMGPPATKFGGRPAVPAGPLQRYPGGVADIDTGNRRLAKSKEGAGMDDGVSYRGAPSGFKMTQSDRGTKAPGMRGRSAMKDNKK